MGYMDNVEMADILAGGPRRDLDDVIITTPTRVQGGVYRVPEELPLLDYLEQQVRVHDFVEIMDEFYEGGGDDRYPVWLEILDAYNVHNESPEEARGPHGVRAVRRMYNRYGEAVWRANPHLTKADVYRHMVEMGFDGTQWAFYQFLNRNGGEAATNTERTRLARGKGRRP